MSKDSSGTQSSVQIQPLSGSNVSVNQRQNGKRSSRDIMLLSVLPLNSLLAVKSRRR